MKTHATLKKATVFLVVCCSALCIQPRCSKCVFVATGAVAPPSCR